MLIVVPTAKEFDALLGECRVREFDCSPTALGRLTVHRVAELRAHVACGGLGKTEFGVRTQHLLDHSEVSLLVCAGGAGALIGDLAIGDVVVATETVEHDFKSRFSNRPPPRVSTSIEAVDALRAAPNPSGFSIHFGSIASGDEDVVGAGRANEIHELTGAVAVAWEGAGGARAAAFSGTRFLEIRGITDRADSSASESYDNNLRLAMRNALSVLAMLAMRVT